MSTLEADTRKKYSDGSVYPPDEISASLFDTGTSFSSFLLAEKRGLLLPLAAGKRVLDLGCGNGRHLAELADRIAFGMGIDFSLPFIRYAAEQFKDRPNLRFALADARALPVADGSFDCAYSFAALYYLDDIEPVYAELGRVLAPGGVALLEVGNARSLATLVSRHYPSIARHGRRTIGDHLRVLRRQGFTVVDWRSFQLLPMWGDQPPWLQFLRAPWLERLITRQIGGRMLDQWICGLAGVRMCAFRHFLLLQSATPSSRAGQKAAGLSESDKLQSPRLQ